MTRKIKVNNVVKRINLRSQEYIIKKFLRAWLEEGNRSERKREREIL